MHNKQRIMTITAKSLFKYFPKKKGENIRFCFDARKRSLYPLVVKAEVDMEECPLFYQFQEVLKENKNQQQKSADNECTNNEGFDLYDQFLIMDFEDIFLPIKDDASDDMRNWKESLRNNVKDIIENGFDVQFDDCTIHMMPVMKKK